MLELQSVSGGYDGVNKLYDISLTAADGQILSIIGPNGSGKSTLLRMMSGLQLPYAGNVLLDGRPICRMARRELARSLSYLPQGRNIPAISVSSLVMHGRFPYLGYPRRYSRNDIDIAEQAMAWAGVLPLKECDMAKLSGGERQKVYLAMLLTQDTRVILMDEPATYLDIAHQLEIMRLVRKLRAAGKTVVMVLHDINLALSYSDLVAVMRQGRLEMAEQPAKVFESGILDEVFGIRVISQTIEGVQRYFYE